MNLPISGSPEERKTKADLYTYAVFAASLLGEIGALLHRQRITLFSRGRSNLGEWSPLANDIDSFPKARYMKIEFRREHVGTSRSLSLMYAARILPADGLQWIESDPEVLGEFLQAFADRPGGPIHDLAVKGSRASITRAEPVMGTPYFGAETAREPGRRKPASNDVAKQGVPVRKERKDRQSAGTNGTGQSRTSTTAGRRKNQESGTMQQARTKDRHDKPKSKVNSQKANVTNGHVKKQPVMNQDPVSRPESPDGFTTWVQKVITESARSQVRMETCSM